MEKARAMVESNNNRELQLRVPLQNGCETGSHEKLWVDKYSPRSFAELVSDDVGTSLWVFCEAL